MKIFEESIKPSEAWMLSYDGDAIPCYVHPFGDKDSDAIEDAAWLYCNDKDCDLPLVEYIANMFIEDFMIQSENDLKNSAEDIEATIHECECLRKYPSNVESLKKRLVLEVQYAIAQAITDGYNFNTHSVETNIKNYLNNNYLRVRYGSEYQTQSETPGALYFRISSTGKDWYNQIMAFCLELSEKRPIKTVTIERDKASTGSDKVYVNHMTWDEFLFKKRFVVDSLKRGIQD